MVSGGYNGWEALGGAGQMLAGTVVIVTTDGIGGFVGGGALFASGAANFYNGLFS
jgi:hypothetical protein